MAVDLSVYSKGRSLSDYMNANRDQQLQQQLMQAQVQKAQTLDADKLGEQAFMKAAQGLPLTPQEEAAARLLDAKSGGIMFNPATGAVQAKPRISDKIGLGGTFGSNGGMPAGGAGGGMPAGASGGGAPAAGASDPFEAQYQAQLRAAAGNPKLQQSIREEYSKSKMKYNEDQAKSAGFTDRMAQANPQIQQNEAAGTSWGQAALDSIPLVGNALISDERQRLDQAQRNFINAQLRRESGAAISESEFQNARKQYFPQPGDSDTVLKQKAQNRQTATEAMQRASGAAYVPSGNAGAGNGAAAPERPKRGQRVDGYMYMGGDPGDQNNWKKVK